MGGRHTWKTGYSLESGFPAVGLVARAGRLAECEAGNHEPVTVPKGRVVYTPGPGARKRGVGERYCRNCRITLGGPEVNEQARDGLGG